MTLIKKLSIVLIVLIFTSLGIKLLSDSFLPFVGTAGIATILTYVTNSSWGLLFFIVNLPFFSIYIQELGKWFTFSSLLKSLRLKKWREIKKNILLAQPYDFTVSYKRRLETF